MLRVRIIDSARDPTTHTQTNKQTLKMADHQQQQQQLVIDSLRRELEVIRETTDEEYTIAVTMAASDRASLERRIALLIRERDDALLKAAAETATPSDDSDGYHQHLEEIVEELEEQIRSLKHERDDALSLLALQQRNNHCNNYHDEAEHDGPVDERIANLIEERDDAMALHRMEQRHASDLREELMTLQIKTQEFQNQAKFYKEHFEQAQSQLDQLLLPLRDVDVQLDQLLDDIKNEDEGVVCAFDEKEDEKEGIEYESWPEYGDYDDAISDTEEEEEMKLEPSILSSRNLFLFKYTPATAASSDAVDDEQDTKGGQPLVQFVKVSNNDKTKDFDDNHRQHRFDQALLSSIEKLLISAVGIDGGEKQESNKQSPLKEFKEQRRPSRVEYQDDLLEQVLQQQKNNSKKPPTPTAAVFLVEVGNSQSLDDFLSNSDVDSAVEDEQAAEERVEYSFCSVIDIIEEEDGANEYIKEFSEQPRPQGSMFQDVMVEEAISRHSNKNKPTDEDDDCTACDDDTAASFYNEEDPALSSPPASPLKEYGERRHVGSLQWQLLEKQTTKQNWVQGLTRVLAQ